VLELQRRDHYIQLPPPGSNLTYLDHYAEGVLFKLSKKNRPVGLFSNNGGKESTGVWKERWVVIQGSRLLIYHKRKVRYALHQVKKNHVKSSKVAVFLTHVLLGNGDDRM